MPPRTVVLTAATTKAAAFLLSAPKILVRRFLEKSAAAVADG
jgi:hypothetical protein